MKTKVKNSEPTKLNFHASIYQIDKYNETAFEYKINGVTEKLDITKVSSLLAERTFKVVKAQQNIENSGSKARFFGLSKTKKLYFYFALDGVKILESEILESIKINLAKVNEEEAMQIVLFEIMNIFADCENVVL